MSKYCDLRRSTSENTRAASGVVPVMHEARRQLEMIKHTELLRILVGRVGPSVAALGFRGGLRQEAGREEA